MQKINTQDFEKELQAIDKRILIVPNKNRPGASNVILNGVDICPWVHSTEIRDEHSKDYEYMLPNDTRVPFKTADEIREIVKLTLNKAKQDTEFSDMLFGGDDIKEESYGEHKA